MIILGFYAVVAGWCLQYFYASILNQLDGDAAFVTDYFTRFSSHPFMPVCWALLFILLTHFVVVRGVREGIERTSKLLMPLLLVLLVMLVVAACMLPGSAKGVEFLLKPDFSKLSGSVFLEALGQAFFSLSLGTACLCTYASYFGRDTNLLGSAVKISLLDSLIAILAGLMIFPAAFSVGISPDSGASLVFITLPNVFQQAFAGMPFLGRVISFGFYALLTLAALTSLMSLHEVSTAFLHEEFNWSRRKAAACVTTSCIVLGSFCSLSLGGYDGLHLFGMSLFDIFDFVTGQIFLPVGGFLTCLFIGWFVPRTLVYDEYTNGGTVRATFFGVFFFLVRYVCPLSILLIFLHQLGVI
jgi:NSS family neurotransmitter:Na+ symporter